MRTLETYQHTHPELGVLTSKKIVARNAEGEVVDEYAIHPVTAEDWLAVEGMTPLRLVTLLYLITRLSAAGVTAPKVHALQAWIDGILAAFAQDPAGLREDWPMAPHTFEDAVQEAFALLAP